MYPHRDEIQQWIAWTRTNLPREGDIPHLDWAGPQLEAAEVNDARKTEPPWMGWITEILDDAALGESPERREGIAALFAQAMLAAEPDDVAPRFTALHFHYSLATDDWPDYSMYSKDLSENAQGAFRRELRALVSVLPVEECPRDRRRIRWEISNAVAAEDWDRARRLFQLAEGFLSSAEARDLRFVRGQLSFFRAVDSDRPERKKANYWMLSINPADDPPGSYFVFQAYKNALTEAPERFVRHDLDEQTKELIRDARSDLEKAIQNDDVIHPSYHAMLGTCYLALGDHAHAATEYQKVLVLETAFRRIDFDILSGLIRKATPQPGEDVTGHLERVVASSRSKVVRDFKPDLFRMLARSYILAGDLTKAKSAYRQWEHGYPEDPRVYRHLAELLAQELKYKEAYEALRKEVELLPEVEDAPGYRVALALGAIAVEQLDLDSVTRQILAHHPEVEELLDRLFLDSWPTYRKMGGETRRIWRFASVQSYYNSSVQPTLATQYRQMGAEKFAKAVEIELRQGVFQKFRSDTSGNVAITRAAGRARKDADDYLFAQFILGTGKLALGQMYFILAKAGAARGELFTALRQWTPQHFSNLDTRRVELLRRIFRPRNLESHEAVSVDVSSVPGFCREFLDALLANAAFNPAP